MATVNVYNNGVWQHVVDETVLAHCLKRLQPGSFGEQLHVPTAELYNMSIADTDP